MEETTIPQTENNEQPKKGRHGGPRPGSGRHKTKFCVATIAIRIPADILEILNRQKNRSEYIIAAIRAYENARSNGEAAD